MTDPVDTEALRKAGERADYYQTGEGPLWRAAADEMDRLRANLGTQERVNADLKRAADAFLEEHARLRAVIENAPHAPACGWQTSYVNGFAAGGCVIPNAYCTCWKADAL